MLWAFASAFGICLKTTREEGRLCAGLSQELVPGSGSSGGQRAVSEQTLPRSTGQLVTTSTSSTPWWAGEGVLARLHPARAKIASRARIYAFRWTRLFSGNRLKLLANWKQRGIFVFHCVLQSSVIQQSQLSRYSSEAATSFYAAVTWPPWPPSKRHRTLSLHAMFPCSAC